MSLDDLERHIDDQNEKIKKLIEDRCFSDLEPSLHYWESFRCSLWGKRLEHLQAEKSKEQEEVEVKAATELIPEVKMDDGSFPEVEMDDEPPSDAAVTRPVVKIPGVIPSVRKLDSPWVLVRSEYEEASRAALSANTEYDDVLIITGQPGIGPPLSSLILVRRTRPLIRKIYLFDLASHAAACIQAPNSVTGSRRPRDPLPRRGQLQFSIPQ